MKNNLKLILIGLIILSFSKCSPVYKPGLYYVRQVNPDSTITFYKTTWMWGDSTPVKGKYQCTTPLKPGDCLFVQYPAIIKIEKP